MRKSPLGDKATNHRHIWPRGSQVGGVTSRHLDLNALGQRLLVLLHAHHQDAVLELRAHLGSVGIVRQHKAAQEAAVAPLDPVITQALVFLLERPLAAEVERAVLDRDLHVLFPDLGKFGLDDVFAVILGDVHQGSPLGNGHGLFPAAIPARRTLAQQRGQTALKLLHLFERIPACDCSHSVLKKAALG